jgi:hypothetical protein
MNYQRASWNKVLDCLKDAGLYSKGNVSGAVSKELKERFKRFNAAFEEVYRTQTTWIVHDCDLREELQISITQKLLPAYRSFQGRYMNHLDSERHAEKYIKYTSEDLDKYLVELFEGSSDPWTTVSVQIPYHHILLRVFFPLFGPERPYCIGYPLLHQGMWLTLDIIEVHWQGHSTVFVDDCYVYFFQGTISELFEGMNTPEF